MEHFDLVEDKGLFVLEGSARNGVETLRNPGCLPPMGPSDRARANCPGVNVSSPSRSLSALNDMTWDSSYKHLSTFTQSDARCLARSYHHVLPPASRAWPAVKPVRSSLNLTYITFLCRISPLPPYISVNLSVPLASRSPAQHTKHARCFCGASPGCCRDSILHAKKLMST